MLSLSLSFSVWAFATFEYVLRTHPHTVSDTYRIGNVFQEKRVCVRVCFTVVLGYRLHNSWFELCEASTCYFDTPKRWKLFDFSRGSLSAFDNFFFCFSCFTWFLSRIFCVCLGSFIIYFDCSIIDWFFFIQSFFVLLLLLKLMRLYIFYNNKCAFCDVWCRAKKESGTGAQKWLNMFHTIKKLPKWGHYYDSFFFGGFNWIQFRFLSCKCILMKTSERMLFCVWCAITTVVFSLSVSGNLIAMKKKRLNLWEFMHNMHIVFHAWFGAKLRKKNCFFVAIL